jgi:Protein of unknown function (DUF4254)
MPTVDLAAVRIDNCGLPKGCGSMRFMQLPSRFLLAQACAGTVRQQHPLLIAGSELARLHESKLERSNSDIPEIDCARAHVIHKVDCWVSAHAPEAVGAAFLHTETMGMVIDRMAEYSVAARVALEQGVSEPHIHYLWHRVSEIALGYADLVFEVSIGRRRLPDLADPWATQQVSARMVAR